MAINLGQGLGVIKGLLNGVGKSNNLADLLYSRYKLSIKPNQSNINSHLNSTTSVKATTRLDANMTANFIHSGNGFKGQVNAQIQGAIKAMTDRELFQRNNEVVAGKQNGKPVYSNVQSTIQQTAKATTDATYGRTAITTYDTNKNVTKVNDKTTVTNTNIKATNTGTYNANTAVDRVVDTKVETNILNKAGDVTGTKFSNQVVTTDQDVAVAQTSDANSNRNILQTVTAKKEGNTSNTKVNTIDVTTGSQNINTNTVNVVKTGVENKDKNGNVISTRNSEQTVTTNDDRDIDSTRFVETDQDSKTVNKQNGTQTITDNKYSVNALTTDNTKTTGTIQNLNGPTTNIDRESTVITNENREGDSKLKTSVEKENGTTSAVTDFKTKENADVNTNIIYQQDGKTTTIRNINTESDLKTTGTIENTVDANGKRVVTVDASRVATSETTDLTANVVTGNTNLTKSEATNETAIQGKIEVNPAAQAGPAAPGNVIIEFGTYTGVRSSFKLDNGNMTFDFTVDQATLSQQDTTAVSNGKVSQSSALQGTAGTVHFSGQVVSSVDDQGNRVYSLQADVTKEQAGARITNNNGQEGVQVDLASTKLELNGQITVDRDTTTVGNKTTTTVKSTAELNINKVENVDSAGLNVKTLTPIANNDGLTAGMIADKNGALSFNFGTFDFKVRFAA